MIKTVGDLLQALMVREAAVLAMQDVDHPPTIGAMYEGLTQDVVRRTLPFTGALSVVSGFAMGPKGEKSRQLDCMLITGDAEKIPYTQQYNVPAHQVIAVIEVKKTLYQSQLDEGFHNLKSVLIDHGQQLPLRRSLPTAFQSISGLALPDDPSQISDPAVLMLYHHLVVELMSPARILLGYEGYKGAKALRAGVVSYINTLFGKQGGGPLSMPDLIMTPSAAVVKSNGLPYAVPMKDGVWPVLLSVASEKPAMTLLEIIWTRLHIRVGGTPEMFGEDMDLEALVKLLDYKFVPAASGWQIAAFPDVSKEQLTAVPQEWEPIELDDTEHRVVMRLCEKEEIDLNSPPSGADLNKLKKAIDRLVRAGLVGPDASRASVFRLLTKQCATASLPDGRIVAGENISGRLTRWIARYMETRKK